MASFYHIFIQPRAGVTDDSVKEIMNLAIDWYQYSEYCWVVKTTSNAKKWQSRLKPFVDPEGNLLIIKIDPSDRQGWTIKKLLEVAAVAFGTALTPMLHL